MTLKQPQLQTMARWIILPLMGFGLAKFAPPLLTLIYLIALAAITYYDWRERRIPNAISYPTLLLAFGAAILAPFGLVNAILGSLVAGLLFLLPVFIYGSNQAGIGDVKLALLMGLTLGFTPTLYWALLWAFALGAAVGLGGLALGKLDRRSSIPFGPFMAFGTILGLIII